MHDPSPAGQFTDNVMILMTESVTLPTDRYNIIWQEVRKAREAQSHSPEINADMLFHDVVNGLHHRTFQINADEFVFLKKAIREYVPTVEAVVDMIRKAQSEKVKRRR